MPVVCGFYLCPEGSGRARQHFRLKHYNDERDRSYGG